MKDFKSQAIDTPGVINRVSDLFRGHARLIQGFNTFLPPGYYIDCGVNPHEGNYIRVTTPSGHSTCTSDLHHPPANPPPHHNRPEGASASPAPAPLNNNLTAQGPHYLTNRRAPLEFNHAINYVNKIKTRFANQPDLYKQFLEILQTYQRESKPIQDVYTQVQGLFQNSPDLLEEFKQFLPDISGPSAEAHLADDSLTSNVAAPPAAIAPVGTPGSVSRLPPVGDFGPGSATTSHEPYGSPAAGAPSEHGTPSKAPGSVGPPDAPLSGQNRKKRGNPAPPPPTVVGSKKRPRTQPQTKGDSVAPAEPTTVPSSYAPAAGPPVAAPPASTEPKLATRAPFSEEELEFFAVVRNYLGHKSTYTEFLKLLNLYNEEIIDDRVLVERASSFIGNHEGLFNRFKNLIGYKPPEAPIDYMVAPRTKLDLSTLKARGSYRRLPLNETKARCSGRDDLCREVLNDLWASHPTWASEETGFTSHKKNIAEENLHKCEEERYDFDLNIDSNLSTIALLEPIARQIEQLSPEERAKYRVPVSMFGESHAIYRRMLKKVYGAERGLEVIDLLHTTPVTAVPVVLRRLKQKDEEWRKLRRQQNRVWREVDNKNFFRSLDYQTPQIRLTERKQMSTKFYVTEIEKIRKDALEGLPGPASWNPAARDHRNRNIDLDPALRAIAHAYPPSYHMEFSFADAELVREAIQMILSYFDKTQSSNNPTRAQIDDFFAFVEAFLGATIRQSTTNHTDTSMNTSTGSQTTSPTQVQHTWIHTQHTDSAISPGNGNSTVPASENEVTDRSVPENPAEKHGDIKWNTFYGNTPMYVFFRHFQILYARLEQVKQSAEKCARTTVHDPHDQTPAGKLDLLYKPEIFSDVDLQETDYFQLFLNLADRHFDGEMETQVFEDAMRFLFRTQAHNVVTIGKLIQLLLKHLATVVTDTKCQDLLGIYDELKGQPMASVRQQILYRMKVESIIGTEEHLYRIEFLPEPLQRVCTIQLLLKDDFTLSHAVTSEEKWAYYVDSFVLMAPTEGVSFHGQYPFLRRNLPREAPSPDSAPRVISHSGLEVKISLNTYRICFVTHSEDFFMRVSRPTSVPASPRPAKSEAESSTTMDVDGADPEPKPKAVTKPSPTDPALASMQRANRDRVSKWHSWLEANQTTDSST
ncbi:hypothetical protein BJ085DRAFT_15119 [Dimargaris cristalligena]|uniref:Histone deacetylase interacting domain-containing protein n=1 Tax=Dimargaris cristalligena TaxID=215637 RepID=A0A4P9ZQ56_9FUNG|nr:hypothetical protein BJ085DRAFT_15119 [Dimargaris cristalligena]|eukprot:RKP34752.1 hypothetical protein BJ085DRAFT_15119 [Dimargaris cristalligena]